MSEVPYLKVERMQHKPNSGPNMSTTRPSYLILNITWNMLALVSSLRAFAFTLLEFQGCDFKIKTESNYICADSTKYSFKTPDILTMIEC